MKKLKKEVLYKIKSDTGLFTKVCTLTGTKPSNLARALDRNGIGLNQYSVVECIAEHLQMNPKELVEELEYETQS